MRWGGIFDIDSKRVEVEEEELRTHVPDFWEHQKEAQAQMKKVKELHQWIDSYDELDKAVGELQLAWDFIKEGLVEESELYAMYGSVMEKHAATRGGLARRRVENQLRGRWHRKSGLGVYAHAHVSALV